MVRKCAKFAFGLALLLALGFAISHAAPSLKVTGVLTGFAVPCEPSVPAFKATSEPSVVSTMDSSVAVARAGIPAGVVRRSRVEAASRSIPLPAPEAYPPLFHRPPPANS